MGLKVGQNRSEFRLALWWGVFLSLSMRVYCCRLILIVFVVILSGCLHRSANRFPTEPGFSAGIFLDVNEPVVTPKGELRPLFDRGIRLTKQSEGFRGHLYNDAANYCTIAYGHLVKRMRCNGNEAPEFLRGLSEPEGSSLLNKDMQRAQQAVMVLVAVQTTDAEYAALCDFVYNVGVTNFDNSTLRKVINAQQKERIPMQFRRGIKAGGKELPALKTRREREVDMFFDGAPIPKGAPSENEDLSPIDIRKGESTR